MRRILRIWRNLSHRARLEEDLDAELRAYVDLSAGEKMKAGMTPASARRAALVESEGVEQVKERVRDVRAGNLLETVLRDIRFGARLLAKNPGFTTAAVVMLALGIGANTAVFSVLNAVLLRGLPYSDADRIVVLYEKRPRENNWKNVVSPPDFLDWREQNTSFASMAAVAHDGVTWQSDAGAERVMAGIVSPEFFDVFGVKPALGPGFRSEKELRGSYQAAILTHGFWQRRFGADPAVLGRAITINGTLKEIVGILPANFEYPVRDVELFVPLWWRTRENQRCTRRSAPPIARPMMPWLRFCSGRARIPTALLNRRFQQITSCGIAAPKGKRPCTARRLSARKPPSRCCWRRVRALMPTT